MNLILQTLVLLNILVCLLKIPTVPFCFVNEMYTQRGTKKMLYSFSDK